MLFSYAWMNPLLGSFPCSLGSKSKASSSLQRKLSACRWLKLSGSDWSLLLPPRTEATRFGTTGPDVTWHRLMSHWRQHITAPEVQHENRSGTETWLRRYDWIPRYRNYITFCAGILLSIGPSTEWLSVSPRFPDLFFSSGSFQQILLRR